MKKSKEQLQAEQIVASLLRINNGDEQFVLNKAKHWASDVKFAIAQRVTVTVFLATLHDLWEDFTEDDVRSTYQEYLKYYDSYSAGNENIFAQMLAVNEMLGGELLTEKILEITEEKVNEEQLE